ncbi:uncharacterized protein N7515_001815 [Penicillium bovifimosum]|uniref:Myb-like domain-containing protein n=1 Tax=Penicillium bovifimosum TaxID=126998 RepID=A0A9W9L8N3_9EURO|nr:uncharacterized protein N7515_001815 [Penicillium bovifimosum]KAJ5143028.1 hypothetical protein N7515_001815 [Penicillium bovifimosum]
MIVDLNHIEFYNGPSRPPFSTSATSVPPNHGPAHVPRYFQQSFPTGFGFRAGPCEVPPGQSPPLTGTTHEWNIFDTEINHIYGPTQPAISKDIERAVTKNMPAARDIALDRGSSAPAFSEPVPSTDSVNPSLCPVVPENLDHITPDMRGDELTDAVPGAKEMEHSQLSCVSCVTAPAPTAEQANCVSSNLSVVGDSEQELAKRKLSTTEGSDSLHSGDFENFTEPSQTSDLGENPCSRANDAPGRAEDSGTAEDKSAPSCPSAPPTVRSTSECAYAPTTMGSDIPVRYPSIAVVVPPPSPFWKAGATRTSTRAAAAVCKKRLRSGRGIGNHQDGNTSFYNPEQPCQNKKKRRPSIRPLPDPSDSSTPVSCHCPGAIQGIRGSALLTVQSNSGLKPAYFFTFVPDPSPKLFRPHTAVISGKQRPYTSDENVLLVRLKEREAMSWSEITAHFPGRNMSSLQVHYSTKLRHKASSRSGRTKRRE